MAKKTTRTKATAKRNQEMAENALEHTVDEDDNYLPEPEKLKQYKELDPRFLDYFMERGISEQNSRHNLNDKSVSFFGTVEKNATMLEKMRLSMSFIIILILIAVSVYLIVNDYNLWGTIFSGASMVAILFAFVNGRNGNIPKIVKEQAIQSTKSE